MLVVGSWRAGVLSTGLWFIERRSERTANTYRVIPFEMGVERVGHLHTAHVVRSLS